MTWEQVAFSAPNGGWEWDQFDVRWTGEQFAWSRQSGCSCNYFEYAESMYQVGDQQVLLTAITQWNGGMFGSTDDVIALISKVNEWKAAQR